MRWGRISSGLPVNRTFKMGSCWVPLPSRCGCWVISHSGESTIGKEGVHRPTQAHRLKGTSLFCPSSGSLPGGHQPTVAALRPGLRWCPWAFSQGHIKHGYCGPHSRSCLGDEGACESDKEEAVVTGLVRGKGGSLRLCPLGMGCSQTPV